MLDALVTDYSSPQAALTAVEAAGGGRVRFPIGTTTLTLGALTVGLTDPTAPVTFAGAGAGVSTLAMVGGASSTSCILVNVHGARVALEDLTIDAANGVNVHGVYTRGGLAARRCEFIRNEFGAGIFVQGGAGVDVVDCAFVSRDLRLDGRAPRGVQVLDGTDVRIRGSRFVNLYNGIDLSGYVARVSVVDCHAVGSWYTLPSRLRSSDNQPSVGVGTWTTDGLYVRLTDAGAFPDPLFTADPFTVTHVRVLVQVGTATVSAAVGGHVYASGSPGITGWAFGPGDVVRVGSGYQGIVLEIVADTELVVEGWHDPVTLAPVAAPPSGTLTGYRVVMGSVFEANTADSLRIYPQFLDGTPVTAETLAGYGALATYEVEIAHNNYSGLQATATVTDVTVIGGTWARSHSDQISTFGPRSVVVAPRVYGGQDQGITCNGAHSMVVAPHVREQGQGGLFSNGDDIAILGGDLSRTPRRLEVGDDTYGAELMLFGQRQSAIGVQVDGESIPKARVGLSVSGSARLVDCASRGHRLASVTVYGDGAAAEVVRGRYQDAPADGPVGKIRHLAGATVGTYATKNDDAPDPATEAADGSLHTQDLGTGKTQLWRKLSGAWTRIVGRL
jgi:hypothetical protein